MWQNTSRNYVCYNTPGSFLEHPTQQRPEENSYPLEACVAFRKPVVPSSTLWSCLEDHQTAYCSSFQSSVFYRQDGRAVQGAAFRSQSTSVGVGSNPTLNDRIFLSSGAKVVFLRNKLESRISFVLGLGESKDETVKMRDYLRELSELAKPVSIWKIASTTTAHNHAYTVTGVGFEPTPTEVDCGLNAAPWTTRPSSPSFDCRYLERPSGAKQFHN
ncbi:hypothetical protein M514_11076 [Trichuris suis]|uniref:Uncharacterized protein n=1 Tax=Trichuris suis TaxID=68888 RepID=A0A085N0Z7_9BILA|nr:hypothetical protein M514_11076 [Trichuris suis]